MACYLGDEKNFINIRINFLVFKMVDDLIDKISSLRNRQEELNEELEEAKKKEEEQEKLKEELNETMQELLDREGQAVQEGLEKEVFDMSSPFEGEEGNPSGFQEQTTSGQEMPLDLYASSNSNPSENYRGEEQSTFTSQPMKEYFDDKTNLEKESLDDKYKL